MKIESAKPNNQPEGNAYIEIMTEKINKKTDAKEPLSELEKAFLREKEVKKTSAANEEIAERSRERRESHAP